MKKRYWIPPLVLVLIAGAFFAFAPGYFEAESNRIDGKPLPKISAEAYFFYF